MRKIIDFVYDLVNIYTRYRISRSAAEFSYFLTLSVFPLLICLTALLSNLDINEGELISLLERVLPENVVTVFSDYLKYVVENYDQRMLIVAVAVMATSSAGAVRSIFNIMSDIHGKARYSGIWGLLISLALAIGLLLTFYLSMIILVTGDWFISLLESLLGISLLANIWNWLRFVVLLLIMIILINLLYMFSAPKTNGRKKGRWIGALAASVSIVIFSIIFSGIIEMSSRYSLIYGSLASLIVLMVWAYTCGIILIMGNVLNIVISQKKLHKISPAK